MRHSAQFEQAIGLLDEVAPELTITCPADAALEADEDCTADTSGALDNTCTTTANCDTDLDISLTHEDVLTEGCGATTRCPDVHAPATDHCDNTTTVTCAEHRRE